MSGLEVNKILAAIIMAVLIIFLINTVGDLLINPDSQESSVTAYKIEESDSDSSKIASNKKNDMDIQPISSFLANASVEQGKKVYKKCGACHNIEKDSANKVGPNLWNLINRPKANISGFAYSKALAELGGEWTYEDLSQFLYKPKDYLKGTKMNFSGLKKDEDRANLILFLRNQSDNPVPLP